MHPFTEGGAPSGAASDALPGRQRGDMIRQIYIGVQLAYHLTLAVVCTICRVTKATSPQSCINLNVTVDAKPFISARASTFQVRNPRPLHSTPCTRTDQLRITHATLQGFAPGTPDPSTLKGPPGVGHGVPVAGGAATRGDGQRLQAR